MAITTITTTAAQDARIIAAFGKRMNLGRDATAAEVKQQIVQFLINAVQEQEVRIAVEAAQSGVNAINPT